MTGVIVWLRLSWPKVRRVNYATGPSNLHLVLLNDLCFHPIAMAAVAKKNVSVTGAPSQFKKTGRKGKGAWRKNVDIDDVEAGMEEIRKEEAIIGYAENIKHVNI